MLIKVDLRCLSLLGRSYKRLFATGMDYKPLKIAQRDAIICSWQTLKIGRLVILSMWPICRNSRNPCSALSRTAVVRQRTSARNLPFNSSEEGSEGGNTISNMQLICVLSDISLASWPIKEWWKHMAVCWGRHNAASFLGSFPAPHTPLNYPQSQHWLSSLRYARY